MQIEYVTTRSQRGVADGIGARLVKAGIAREVAVAAPIRGMQVAAVVIDEAQPMSADDDGEVSPRTGKPKRKYKRRDMSAED